MLKLQHLNSLYLVTSGVPDKVTRQQNLIGMGVRYVAEKGIHYFTTSTLLQQEDG